MSRVLENPALQVFDGAGEPVAFNNNWKDDQQGETKKARFRRAMISNQRSCARCHPGNYTAVARGEGDATGIGLVEVYDLSSATPAQLANISSRGFVETGENVMIGGFFILNGSQKVIVRALGPSLPVDGSLAARRST